MLHVAASFGPGLLALDFEPRPRAFGLKLVACADVNFQAQSSVWGIS
jgi:hypothetical protein